MTSTPQSSEASSQPPPRKKKKRVRYILLGIVLLLLLGELTVRFFGGRDSTFDVRLGIEKELDPYRRTKLKKNFVSADIRTNSRGFLGPEFDVKKSPGSYRIVVLGDSTAFVPPRRPYPRALEDLLRKAIPNRQIDVINACCSGYDSGQARVWYEREIDAIDHDMLIIYLGWNDMGQYNPDGLVYRLQETGYLKQPSLLQRAILHVYLLRSLYALQSLWGRRGDVSLEPLSPEDAKKYGEFYPSHFENNLRAVIDLAKSRGRTVRILNFAGLIVAHPTPEELKLIHFPRGLSKQLPKYQALLGDYRKALSTVAETTHTPGIHAETTL